MTLSDDATWILIGMTRVGETVEGVARRKERGEEKRFLVFIVARVLPIVVAFFVFINK